MSPRAAKWTIAALVTGALALAVEAAAAWRQMRHLEAAEREWQRVLTAGDLAQAMPRDLAAAAAQGAREHAAEVRRVEAWQRAAGVDPARAEPKEDGPGDRAQEFMAVLRFVQAMQHAATESGVAVAPGERFGFATYAHSGPEGAAAEWVHRQRRAAEVVLRLLWLSQPETWVALRRTRPPDGAGGLGPEGVSEDYFVPNGPTLGLPQTGLRRLPLQVEFTGEVTTLRAFVQGLADAPGCWLVRLVEVEPLDEQPAAFATLPGAEPSRTETVALLSGAAARFRVTVEWVEPARPVNPEEQT